MLDFPSSVLILLCRIGLERGGLVPLRYMVFGRELREECGLDAVDEPVPMAILRDDEVGTWEVVYRATVDRIPTSTPGWEHDRLAAVRPRELPDPASEAAVMLVPLADAIVEASSGG